MELKKALDSIKWKVLTNYILTRGEKTNWADLEEVVRDGIDGVEISTTKERIQRPRKDWTFYESIYHIGAKLKESGQTWGNIKGAFYNFVHPKNRLSIMKICSY
ncbi:hypothetical protein GOV13_03750 [Candidatus Pacearchaeota archaeon]|nr:hypothetical protein [Candidatus Pacearchaeota archaeon]